MTHSRLSKQQVNMNYLYLILIFHESYGNNLPTVKDITLEPLELIHLIIGNLLHQCHYSVLQSECDQKIKLKCNSEGSCLFNSSHRH
uniref:Uncharacterized protein n=1 Tax=Anguilla anguilla TaxID=7936 RepID=A0A0E9WQC6_ANGAN